MRFINLERKYRQEGMNQIVGMDEAGRGPWAGPLVAAAVILPFRLRLSGLRDSKLLRAAKREELMQILEEKAIIGVGVVLVREIDKWGLSRALEKAYQRALRELSVKPDFLLVDGRDKLNLGYPMKMVVKGDRKVRSIAAASVVAKVTRDRLMVKIGRDFKQFGFEQHKGYGTLGHRKAIKKWGICTCHRRSYLPIKNFIRDGAKAVKI